MGNAAAWASYLGSSARKEEKTRSKDDERGNYNCLRMINSKFCHIPRNGDRIGFWKGLCLPMRMLQVEC